MSDEIVLTSKYWDCECDKNYIRPFWEVACSRCKARRVWQPQSRVNEVIAHGLPLAPARRPTTRAVDLLDSSAKSALVAQPANH